MSTAGPSPQGTPPQALPEVQARLAFLFRVHDAAANSAPGLLRRALLAHRAVHPPAAAQGAVPPAAPAPPSRTKAQPLLLAQVTGSLEQLPSLPALVLELIERIGQPDTDAQALARKVALDPMLAARTLRLANSSFYGMQRQVRSVQEAIAVVGLQTVRNLVLTAVLALTMPGPAGRFDFRAFWRHAVASALCARAIARRAGLDPEVAYTAALLHDIGQLVLATRFTAHYAPVLQWRHERDTGLLEAERELLLLDHTLVGEVLMQHWKFPAVIQQAVAGHHAIEQDERPPLARVLQAADALAHALDLCADARERVPVIDERLWSRLQLDGPALAALLGGVEREFEATASALEPDAASAGTQARQAVRPTRLR